MTCWLRNDKNSYYHYLYKQKEKKFNSHLKGKNPTRHTILPTKASQHTITVKQIIQKIDLTRGGRSLSVTLRERRALHITQLFILYQDHSQLPIITKNENEDFTKVEKRNQDKYKPIWLSTCQIMN